MQSQFLSCFTLFWLFSLQVNGEKRTSLPTCGERLPAISTSIFVSEQLNDNWPWHTAIYHVGIQRQGQENNIPEYKCSGTLIDTNTVLTAAHCVSGYRIPVNAENVLVSLGKRNLNEISSSEFLKVENIIQHSNYSHVDLRNDIAIIKLSTQVTFDDHIQPICLWDPNQSELPEIVGKIGTVIGWGRTETGRLSNTIQEENMTVVDSLTCLESNRPFFGTYISTKTFCAGSRNGTICNDDSGGSLAVKANGAYYIRGIVSVKKRAHTGDMCDPNEYTLFTDVAKHVPWIVEAKFLKIV